MKLCVNIYPKVIRDLNIIGNIPGISLKKPRKVPEICQSRKVGTLWIVWRTKTETDTIIYCGPARKKQLIGNWEIE